MIPEPWAFALLALAIFRAWKLIADDAILDRPRDWLIGRARDSDSEQTLIVFISCVWCSAAWIALAWWLAWYAFPTGALVAATPFALSAVVGIVAVRADPSE